MQAEHGHGREKGRRDVHELAPDESPEVAQREATVHLGGDQAVLEQSKLRASLPRRDGCDEDRADHDGCPRAHVAPVAPCRTRERSHEQREREQHSARLTQHAQPGERAGDQRAEQSSQAAGLCAQRIRRRRERAEPTCR
jgi:hypothetical protein